MTIGHSWGKAGGFLAGLALHYQQGKHLFTARFQGTIDAERSIFFFPISSRSSMEEYGLLYGRRILWNDASLSISLGLSHNRLLEKRKDQNNISYNAITNAVGVPFDIVLNVFNREKERYRILFLIPVGPPTGFSRSIGLKLTGNISRLPYLGIGLTYGWGWHKKY
jgi:hypothetical protein